MANMDVITFRIPVSAHIVKKNGRPIHGRGAKKWIGKSDRLRNAENYLTSIFKAHVIKSGMKPLSGDIHAIYRFYFEDFYVQKRGEKPRRSKKLPDLSNLLELPSDCLQTAGVIENDGDICSFDGSGRFPGAQTILEIELRIVKDGMYERRNDPRCSKRAGDMDDSKVL